MSAFTGNHLPQPDVKGWRRRQRAALRQAEVVTRRTLSSALRDLQQVALLAPCRRTAAAAAVPSMPPALNCSAPGLRCPLPGVQVVAEDAVSSEPLEADEFDAATQDSISYAREIVTKAVDAASAQARDCSRTLASLRSVLVAGVACGVLLRSRASTRCSRDACVPSPSPPQVDSSRIFFKALAPEGGASGARAGRPACSESMAVLLPPLPLPRGCPPSNRAPVTHARPCSPFADVGRSIVHYAKENSASLVVLGARGMGSFKR